MASDLANIMATGQNAALMDPMMAAVGPQLQLSQMMAQQGLSTAPAYPMQAAARLAQALAGVKISNDVQNTLSQQSGNATSEMGKIFPEGTEIGDGLRSASPMVRMLAMQQAGKAMLLNSEVKSQQPGQTLVMPATPRTGGGIVGAGSPALAGAVEAAKNPALIARAGGTAAAEAPFKEGGNITVPGGPSGTQTIPATAATRAAIQPSLPPPQFANPTGGAPLAAPPQTVGPGGRITGPAPYGYGTATTGVKTNNEHYQPAPAAPPSPAAPPVVGGEPVKTPEYQGDVKGREELYGAANKAIGGVIAEHIEAGGKVARDKLNALDSIESAVRAFGPNVVTGPHAEFALRAKEALNGVGLNADWIDKGLPEAEIVTKMNAQLASASAKAMTGRPTQFEFSSWQKNNPGLLTSKQGTLALTDILRQQTQNDIDLGRLAQDKNNWGNWPEVADKFYQSHGLTNPLTGKPMREELAAARAGGGASQGAVPVRVATPDEARKLPKGTPILLPDGTPGRVP